MLEKKIGLFSQCVYVVGYYLVKPKASLDRKFASILLEELSIVHTYITFSLLLLGLGLLIYNFTTRALITSNMTCTKKHLQIFYVSLIIEVC